MQQNVAVVTQSSRIALRTGLKPLFDLAVAEVILAMIGIVVSIAGLGVCKSYLPYSYTTGGGPVYQYTGDGYVTAFGFGLIGAIVGLLCGAAGIGALVGHGGNAATATGRHQRCAVAHFILSILVAIIDFVGFIGFIIPPFLEQNSPVVGFRGALMPISWILSATFLAHCVCSIASSGIACNNWCCCGRTSVELRTEEKRGITHA